jgi:hypothetical protein
MNIYDVINWHNEVKVVTKDFLIGKWYSPWVQIPLDFGPSFLCVEEDILGKRFCLRFTLKRIPRSEILTSVDTTLNAVSDVSEQIAQMVRTKPDNNLGTRYKLITIKGDNEIKVKEGDIVKETITADELEKLDPRSRQLIQTYEKRILKQFRIWSKVYPTKSQSSDPVTDARTDIELEDITTEICSDFNKLTNFMKEIGKDLTSSYQTFKYFCNKVEQVS